MLKAAIPHDRRPVVDTGETLQLVPFGSRSIRGVKIRRWKVGRLKEEAANQEAIIKTRLLAGEMPSKAAAERAVEDAQRAAMTFAQWAEQYMQIEEVRAIRTYRERCQRIEKQLIPRFGKKFLRNITVEDVEEMRRERSADCALSTVNLYSRSHSSGSNTRVRAFFGSGSFTNEATFSLTSFRRCACFNTLRWEKTEGAGWVDVDKGRIHLPATITKTQQARTVPLTATLPPDVA